MSHVFPVARSLAEALGPDAPGARTEADALAFAGPRSAVTLVTDWLPADTASLAPGADGPQGHVQRYEDKDGKPVLAFTWWKISKARRASGTAGADPAERQSTDHTDDLYFRSGRTRPRRSRRSDPNQLDLFASKAE